MAKRSYLNTSPMLIPMSVDVDLVRFERNLLNLGFFAATDPRNENATFRRIEKEVIRSGHKVTVAAEFRCSPELGLPTTADRDKFIAFLKILNEDRPAQGIISNPVKFTGYRMIKELGLTRYAGIYEDINRWGIRMSNTTITSKQTVYLTSKKVYSDDTLHVFNRFRRTGVSNLDGQDRQEGFEVELADWFLENLNQRFVVPEDFSAYKKLKRPISKGIFGFLHIAFHASAGRLVEKSYEDLCNELGVKAYPHLSKIKSTIGLALDELVKIKYLSKWEIYSMATRSGYKIVFTAGSELTQFLNRNPSQRALGGDVAPVKRALDDTDMVAVQSLLDHGVHPEKAVSLVQTYGAERVRDIVEFQESQIDSKKSRIQNPAGLIIFSLESNLPIPVRFVTSRLRKDIEAQARLEDQRRQEDASLTIAYIEWVDEAVNAELRRQYADRELQDKIQSVQSQRGKTDAIFKRVSVEQRKVMALQLIRKEIREGMDIPGIEAWASGQSQYKLF